MGSTVDVVVFDDLHSTECGIVGGLFVLDERYSFVSQRTLGAGDLFGYAWHLFETFANRPKVIGDADRFAEFG